MLGPVLACLVMVLASNAEAALAPISSLSARYAAFTSHQRSPALQMKETSDAEAALSKPMLQAKAAAVSAAVTCAATSALAFELPAASPPSEGAALGEGAGLLQLAEQLRVAAAAFPQQLDVFQLKAGDPVSGAAEALALLDSTRLAANLAETAKPLLSLDSAGIVATPQPPASGELLDAIEGVAFRVVDAIAIGVSVLSEGVQRMGSGAPDEQAVLVAVATAAAAAAAALLASAAVAPGSPYPTLEYDAEAAARYFRARPLEVAARATEILRRSAGFAGSLVSDALASKLEANADTRAKELTELLTALGPTFIKAGQSASIRTDLLPVAYIRGLTALQDQVPPFPKGEAETILDQELGTAQWQPLFGAGGLPSAPIAAASLGQVYRTNLVDGTAVAVKVQRPDVLRTIALDMHLIRDYAAPLAKLLGAPGDLVGTAEAWGRGFVAELDYEAEAANAERFGYELASTPLDGKVFAPPVVRSASTRRVLTTEWVEGERLDRASVAEDVPRLCSVAMITYLQMMLGTGLLHCDPHPGNLLRTADGRLCILDWGLVTTIDPNLQLTLIEHVAHLTARDYAKVPGDLVKLGFVPPGGEELVQQNGVVDFLTDTYSTWSSGGGAAKLDVPALVTRVRELAAESPDGIFQVPPYFAYIAKSFSVLEGIGLQSDPDYSIVAETLPYISQRIILDPSPRTAGALNTFVFGDVKDDLSSRVLDADRVQTLLDGMRRYAEAVAPGSEGISVSDSRSPSSSAADLDRAADALLDVLLSPQPTPLQELVLEQLALVIGASSREAWAALRARSGRLPADASRGGASSSDEPRSLLGLLVDPLGLFRESRLVQNDPRDKEALAAARKLVDVVSELLPGQLAVDPQELSRVLIRKVWERRVGVSTASRRLALKLLEQASDRLNDGAR